MITPVISMSIFLIFFCIHIVVHRVLLKRKIIRLRSVFVYGIGFVVLSILLMVTASPVPFTGIALYVLVSSIVSFFYWTLCLGSETPSAKILATFNRFEEQSRDELFSLFTNESLILKRLADLEQTGYIVLRQGKYSATKRGILLARITHIYRVLFHRPLPS